MQSENTKDSFKDQLFYVGIDYHKNSWNVTVLGEQYEHKTMSQNPDPDLLAAYLKRNFPGGTYHAVYEAGFSGFKSCRRLNELGVNCVIIHPADVPTSQKEKLQKTDKVDSRKLARTLRSNELEAIHIPDVELEADRALVRQRFRMVKDVSRTKNRVKSLLFQFGISIPECFTVAQTRHWSSLYINWLKELEVNNKSLRQVLDNYIAVGEIQRKELLMINKQLRELALSEVYKNNYSLLQSIPGIGLMMAITFLVFISTEKYTSNSVQKYTILIE
jgi:transposase